MSAVLKEGEAAPVRQRKPRAVRRNTTPVACGHLEVVPGCAECEPAPVKVRQPSKKIRALMASEREAGRREAIESPPDRSTEMLGLVLWMGIFAAAGCAVGAWLF